MRLEEEAHARYVNDPEFHARVHLVGRLLNEDGVELDRRAVACVLVAWDLAQSYHLEQLTAIFDIRGLPRL